jgi:hypothetical protein
MNIYKFIAPLLIAGFLIGGIVGCEQQGPAEEAGEEIDENVEEAGESMEEAGEQLKEEAE